MRRRHGHTSHPSLVLLRLFQRILIHIQKLVPRKRHPQHFSTNIIRKAHGGELLERGSVGGASTGGTGVGGAVEEVLGFVGEGFGFREFGGGGGSFDDDAVAGIVTVADGIVTVAAVGGGRLFRGRRRLSLRRLRWERRSRFFWWEWVQFWLGT